MKKKKISKREFIKYCFAGAGALACGIPGMKLLAENNNTGRMSPAVPDELWKWSKEAMFYVKTPRGTKCLICPNECNIKEGETGDCRNRQNFNNSLYSIAYGNPCAVHVDPIEKKPLYHFLPSTKAFSIATAGCNLACLNCQNWNISQASPRDTRNYDLMPEKVVSEAKMNHCKSIAYTYSEPITFYEYTYDASKLAREEGIKNVIVSAGYINEKPLKKFCTVIDGANIDLKSFDDEIYMMLNAGSLKPVLNTLKILKDEGVWLEITNLVVPSWTDDLSMISRMCNWLAENGFDEAPLHFSRFHPMYKLKQLPATPVETLNKARDTAIKEGLKYVYIGNVPGSDAGNTICPNCGETVIKRRGFYILSNKLNNGKCENCGHIIAGLWQ